MLARNEILHYSADTFIGAKISKKYSTADLITLCPPLYLGDIRKWVTSPTKAPGSELTMIGAQTRNFEFKYLKS